MYTSKVISFKDLVVVLDLSKSVVCDDLKFERSKNIESFNDLILFLEAVTFEFIPSKPHNLLYVTYSKDNKKFGSMQLPISLKFLYDIKEIVEQFILDNFSERKQKSNFLTLYKDLKTFVFNISYLILKITTVLNSTTIYDY